MITKTASMAAALGVMAGQPPQPTPLTERKPTVEQIAALDPTSRGQSELLILEIAREYRSYRRVSDFANWALILCSGPPPAGVQESASDDEGTHGRKLYYLFARDEGDYGRIGLTGMRLTGSGEQEKPEPFRAAVGQVIVKESFVPLEVKPDDVPARLPQDHTEGNDGRLFRTGDPAGLFIMAKVSPDEAKGTDRGWIYATVSPDHKSVTGFGRIASCMECHASAKHDRLFGPKWLQHHDTAQKLAAPPGR